jgi:hypothetical protein
MKSFNRGPCFQECLLTYLLTHSVVQNIIWKGDCHLTYQKNPTFFMEPEGS